MRTGLEQKIIESGIKNSRNEEVSSDDPLPPGSTVVMVGVYVQH